MWLSSRVLDSRLRGCGFDPRQRRYVVSFGKTNNSLLRTGSTSQHDKNIVDWDEKYQSKFDITSWLYSCF